MTIGTGAAILGAGALASGTSLLGGMLGSDAAESASKAQTRAAQAQARAITTAARIASNTQLSMFQQQKEMLKPWLQAGRWGLKRLQGEMLEGPGRYRESPDYSLRLREGLDAVNAGASAKGLLQSGPTLKALTRFGQDYATTDYDKFLQRYYQSLTPYQSLSGVGQTTGAGLSELRGDTANMLAQIAMQQGQGLSNVYGQAGQARASGYINTANAWGGALGGISNNLMMMPYLMNMKEPI